METYTFQFPASERIARRAHVGVVSSGDLEVLLQPVDEKNATVVVNTSVKGFRDTWHAVLERFFSENNAAMNVRINDFGATPGMVTMRLAQALEVSRQND